ncbi:MAG: DNA polymerase [Leptospiraceae bacterium]|nr:DNA polymerase [Leptospiraceae bacterium]
MINTTEGFLFDIYNVEEQVYVWILDNDNKPQLYLDSFYPEIYLDGPPIIIERVVRRIQFYNALKERPIWVNKKNFYSNKEVKVLKLVLSKPSVMRKILHKLYAYYGQMDIYHTDIEIPTGYSYAHKIFPLARVKIKYESTQNMNRIHLIQTNDDLNECEYEIPKLKILKFKLKKNHRLGLNQNNPLIIENDKVKYELNFSHPKESLLWLNEILEKQDPDIILSEFGDQIIFPILFQLAQNYRIQLKLDRDISTLHTRQIIRKGTSFNTYGAMIYRAPAYPFFGRWHIDRANSFVFKEAELRGIIELSRISRLPMQRMARASTGNALTAIETDVALQNNYLVPWQKSKVEENKTFYELLRIDKGGLIFQPDTTSGIVFENMAQLDFSQMYPSIMVLHNLSPETVLCQCCKEEDNTKKVPEANYHICNKRKGVVSQALEKILFRRKYYKKILKEFPDKDSDKYKFAEAKQNSLKWMLVTSFGYLGYRNAKFGRIESHESVTAFGREILLNAKDKAEDEGYFLSHAITDCIFIQKKDSSQFTKSELQKLCDTITKETKISMEIEGIYKWLVYPPSKIDPLLPVSNRYFGKFQSGEIKMRGLAARRKDMPKFIKEMQLSLLEIMRQADSISELKALHTEMQEMYLIYKNKLESNKVTWEELLIRKTVGQAIDEYSVENASFLSLLQLQKYRMNVEPGEKVRYIVIKEKHPDKSKRYLVEEMAKLTLSSKYCYYDIEYYARLMWDAFQEIWENFAPEGYFRFTPGKQLYFDFIFPSNVSRKDDF